MTIQIVKREAWGARADLPKKVIQLPIQQIFIHESNTQESNDVYTDMRELEATWTIHDCIPSCIVNCSYAIHPRGDILENTGLARRSTTTHRQDSTLYIAWIGNYTQNYPTQTIITQTAALIKWLQEAELVIENVLIRTYVNNEDPRQRGEKVFATPGQYIYSSLPTIRALVAEKDGIEMICTRDELVRVVREAVHEELMEWFATRLQEHIEEVIPEGNPTLKQKFSSEYRMPIPKIGPISD